MKLKVCGMTDVNQILTLEELGVEFTGMIFYKKSPRYAEGKVLTRELRKLSGAIKLTGVFVDEDLPIIQEKIRAYGLGAVQLCGSESAEFCKMLQQYVEVIKVIHVGKEGIAQELIDGYEEYTNYFLFDTQTAQYGGSGKRFDWSTLSSVEISKPFFLSGGISIDEVRSIKSFVHHNFAGVDINSRFETSPGVKDMNLIKYFISQITGK